MGFEEIKVDERMELNKDEDVANEVVAKSHTARLWTHAYGQK